MWPIMPLLMTLDTSQMTMTMTMTMPDIVISHYDHHGVIAETQFLLTQILNYFLPLNFELQLSDEFQMAKEASNLKTKVKVSGGNCMNFQNHQPILKMEQWFMRYGPSKLTHYFQLDSLENTMSLRGEVRANTRREQNFRIKK